MKTYNCVKFTQSLVRPYRKEKINVIQRNLSTVIRDCLSKQCGVARSEAIRHSK